MVGKYKVITLCGSTKFKEEFLMVQQKLTLKGDIILSPVFFDETAVIAEDKYPMLKDMHIKRIDMSDEIFVINKNGYIGTSTKSEIEYAQKAGKRINYLEKIKN